MHRVKTKLEAKATVAFILQQLIHLNKIA